MGRVQGAAFGAKAKLLLLEVQPGEKHVLRRRKEVERGEGAAGRRPGGVRRQRWGSGIGFGALAGGQMRS